MIASASKSDRLAMWSRHWKQGGLIGCPYVPEGRSPETGFDCYGLVHYLFAELGQPLPSDVYEAGRLFRKLEAGDRVQPWDLAYFQESAVGRRHLGVMVESRWMLHTCLQTNGVARSEITRAPWYLMLTGLYRRKEAA
jgi:cell wall-associated NlpC family hydrolase